MLKLVLDNNPSIRRKCAPVEIPLSKENEKLIFDMREHLYQSQDEEFRSNHPTVREGVGLAAPQVGHNVRMLVVSYMDGEKRVEHMLCNPRFVSNSIRKCYLPGGEGCLSVPDEHPGLVYRDFKVVVEAYDAGLEKDVRITARGFEAVVLQHEMDHLDGVLFYDHISKEDPFYKDPSALEL